MLKLPSCILRYIFSQLKFKDKMSIRHTCKLFYKLCAIESIKIYLLSDLIRNFIDLKDVYIFSNLPVDIRNTKITKISCQAPVLYLNNTTEVLKLSGYSKIYASYIKKIVLFYSSNIVIPNCTNLKLYNCNNCTLPNTVKKLTITKLVNIPNSVKKLTLYNNIFDISYLKNLKDLVLFYSFTIIPSCVKNLKITGPYNINVPHTIINLELNDIIINLSNHTSIKSFKTNNPNYPYNYLPPCVTTLNQNKSIFNFKK